ncbi:MAG: malonic semialdehyde reductase [Alphaproteobacteria bacterium]
MLDTAALDLLFRAARTHRSWRPDPVPEATLRQVWDLTRLPPTSANSSPMRVVFVVTPEAKARLEPCLDRGNVRQTMAAPVTAIVAHDELFYDLLPRLSPATDARAWFADDAAGAAETALRNGSLQGAYLMLAARALGLDVGPMSGFDRAGVDRTFLAGTSWRANFLCNLGHGDGRRIGPRAPRLGFDEACRVV